MIFFDSNCCLGYLSITSNPKSLGTVKELTNIMKKAGITRKEVFDRGVDMLQNRVFVIGGYTNNPNAWGHFLEQRLDKHTQFETRVFVEGLDLFLRPTDDDRDN